MIDATLIKGVTPEKLKEDILNGVKDQLTELKKDFTPKEPEDLLKPIETAKLFKVSLTTIYEWCKVKNGVLKPYKMGNMTYFRRSEILEKLYSSNM